MTGIYKLDEGYICKYTSSSESSLANDVRFIVDRQAWGINAFNNAVNAVLCNSYLSPSDEDMYAPLTMDEILEFHAIIFDKSFAYFAGKEKLSRVFLQFQNLNLGDRNL